jgi:hypothetical protein
LLTAPPAPAHLVAQALAAARGHDYEGVAPLHGGVDDLQLGRPEGAVPPVLLQQRQQAFVVGLGVAVGGMTG